MLLPYTFVSHFYIILWGIFPGLLGILYFISRMVFSTPQNERTFILLFCVYFLLVVISVSVRFGLLRVFGIKIEDKALRVINDNIAKGRVNPNASDKTLLELLFSFNKLSKMIAENGIFYPLFVALLSLFTLFFLGERQIDMYLLLTAIGVFDAVLITLFAIFFAEYITAPQLKELKTMIKKRNLEIKEVPGFHLKKRVNYFILILILILILNLTFISKITIPIIAFLAVELIVVASIIIFLFYSVYNLLPEVESFMEKLSQKEKILFSTGNLSKEALDLSDNLNKSAGELYEAREKERRLAEELQKKVAELEKWYKLTVGRELRMVELKQKIKTLEEDLKGKKPQSFNSATNNQ